MAWWEILLISYGSFVAFVSFIECVYISWEEEDWPLLYTPKDFYEDCGMNWFGSIMCWLGEFILNPVAWICLLFATIISWLFYVGRKY